MKTKFLLSAALALTLMLAACSPKAATPTKKGTAATAIPPVISKPTNTPTKIPQPTATKIPTKAPTTAPTKETVSTPIGAAAQLNDITVKDQAITTGSIMVNLVDAVKPGWVAIFTDNNGKAGTLLGYTAIPAGKSNDVKVTIDATKATDKMIAMLLVDGGTIGKFEYPDKDAPVMNASVNTTVMAIFNKLKTSG